MTCVDVASLLLTSSIKYIVVLFCKMNNRHIFAPIKVKGSFIIDLISNNIVCSNNFFTGVFAKTVKYHCE